MQNKHEKKWCEPLEHVVKQPTRKDTNSQKATKSGLVGVWHKDNFYLSTSTTGNENPPNEYWFANEKYKDDATKSVAYREPRNGDYPTNTQQVQQKKFIDLKIA